MDFERDPLLEILPERPPTIDLEVGSRAAGRVPAAVEQIPRDDERRDPVVLARAEREVGALKAVVDGERKTRQERRGRSPHSRLRGPNAGVQLPQLLTVGECVGDAAIHVDRKRQVQRAVGDDGDRRLEGAAEDLVQGPRRGGVPLAGLREQLFDLAAIGPGAEHGFGGRPPCRQEPPGDAFVLLHEGKRCGVDLHCTPGARFGEVGSLYVGREPAGCSGEPEPLAVVAAPGCPVVRDDPGVEERLAQLEVRVVPLRQRNVEARGKPILADQAVERGVRRIHEVADVGDALEARVARLEGERGEEQTPRDAHLGRGALLGQPLRGEAEVCPQRFGHEPAERVRPLRGERRGKGRAPEQERQPKATTFPSEPRVHEPDRFRSARTACGYGPSRPTVWLASGCSTGW